MYMKFWELRMLTWSSYSSGRYYNDSLARWICRTTNQKLNFVNSPAIGSIWFCWAKNTRKLSELYIAVKFFPQENNTSIVVRGVTRSWWQKKQSNRTRDKISHSYKIFRVQDLKNESSECTNYATFPTWSCETLRSTACTGTFFRLARIAVSPKLRVVEWNVLPVSDCSFPWLRPGTRTAFLSATILEILVLIEPKIWLGTQLTPIWCFDKVRMVFGYWRAPSFLYRFRCRKRCPIVLKSLPRIPWFKSWRSLFMRSLLSELERDEHSKRILRKILAFPRALAFSLLRMDFKNNHSVPFRV